MSTYCTYWPKNNTHLWRISRSKKSGSPFINVPQVLWTWTWCVLLNRYIVYVWMVELVCTMYYLCALELQFNSWFRRHIMTSANHSLRMPRGSSHRVYFHLRLHAKPMFLQHTYKFEESERGAPSIVCRAMIVSIVRNPSMRSRNIWFLCVHVEHIYDLNSRVHEWSILNVSLAKYWYDNHKEISLIVIQIGNLSIFKFGRVEVQKFHSTLTTL